MEERSVKLVLLTNFLIMFSFSLATFRITPAPRKAFIKLGMKLPSYVKTPPGSGGLLQLQDEIVDRSVFTIHPYSLGHDTTLPEPSALFIDCHELVSRNTCLGEYPA